jgi:hypothetical protein
MSDRDDVLECRGETNGGLSSLRLVLGPRLGGGCV